MPWTTPNGNTVLVDLSLKFGTFFGYTKEVGEALEAVFSQHAELRGRITEDGAVRRFVNIYVAGEDIRYQDGLATAVAAGAEVTILPAVAGG